MDISVVRSPVNRPFYTWGDVVRGEVVLRNPNTAKGVEASIKFIGTTRTKIGAKGNNQPSHSIETTLFLFTQDLNVGEKAQQGTDQVWPFEFAFPTGAKATPQKQRYSNHANFQRIPGHALPPSFRGEARPDRPDHNCITYTLEATLTKPYSTHPFPPGTMKVEKSLAFCPVRETENYQPIATPIVQELSIKGHHLLSTVERDQEHSLRGRSEHNIRGHALSIHAPHLVFDIRTEAPEIACAGAKLPMCIGVEYDKERSNVQTIPPVYLRNIIVSLESVTHVRTPTTYLGLGQEPQDSWTETTHLADSGPINIPLPERWDVRDLIKNLEISDTVVPTFKTYNIARTYVLHIDIEAEIAHQPLSVKMERGLTVLPAVSKTPMVGQLRVVPRAMARTSLCDESPPPYEQHEGEAAVASGERRDMNRLPSFRTATSPHGGGWGTTLETVGSVGGIAGV